MWIPHMMIYSQREAYQFGFNRLAPCGYAAVLAVQKITTLSHISGEWYALCTSALPAIERNPAK
jgi:hypothetical protein